MRMRAIALVLLLAWPTAAFGGCAVSSFEPADDPQLRATFAAMLQRGRYGFGAEQTAFVVRMPSGAMITVDWPESDERDGGRWEGAFPAGTIAIVHTHPGWLTMPSRIDELTSTRNGIPVYVLTTTAISKAACDETRVVVEGRW